ncbi:hypothetical protein [Butyrivibrio proteoclasticus]|uniref:hypothetical protein n=1 Tax=Butyrivibrio proteoclasticus TaxID=43305 RepID=UPI00047C5BED|nr:hypothetical protein [Butyrivibrio proteoclasticus]
MNGSNERKSFIVKPSATAYGYSALLCVGSLVCMIFLFNELRNPPRNYTQSDMAIIAMLFGVAALLLLAFAALPIYKSVLVEGDKLTIKKFNKPVEISVKDISFLATETKYRIGKTICMIVIRYGKKELILQDTFTNNFFIFQEYLIESVDRSKCEVVEQ